MFIGQKSRHLIFIILDQQRKGGKSALVVFFLMFVINLERAGKKRDVGHE